MRFKRLALFFFILLIIIAVTAVWFYQRPTRVVNIAIDKLAQADSQQFNGTVQITYPQAAQNPLGDSTKVTIQFNGVYDRQSDQRDSLTTDIKLITEAEGTTLNVDGELRFIGEQAYLRIIAVPDAIPTLAQLKGPWFKLPRGGQSAASRLNNSEEIFTAVELAGKTEIAGAALKTYQAFATPADILRLLDNAADILGTRLTEQQITNFRQRAAGFGDIPVELQITPWSYELRRLSAALAIPNSNTVSLVLTFNNPSGIVNITPPENAVSLVDYAQNLPAPSP